MMDKIAPKHNLRLKRKRDDLPSKLVQMMSTVNI